MVCSVFSGLNLTRFFWSCSPSLDTMAPDPVSNSCYKKLFDNGLNANQYCRCGLTNTKYCDINILE